MREAGGVGIGEAERFFYNACEVGKGLDFCAVGLVGEDFFAEFLISGLIVSLEFHRD